jgi:cyclopropane fatty-acyl-phospholipid synthase-like methyltransferase/DUF1365 family protein
VVTGALYETRIRHVRATPVPHAFDNRSFWWLVDLDDLPVLPRLLRPLARFVPEDHLGSPDRTLRQNVDAFCAARDVDLTGGRVVMLASARVLGHVFNPLSVFWCHAADGSLACVLAEVHNTYGDRHTYLLHTDERGRAETPKEFYVSPFHPVDGSYTMSLPEPGDELDLVVALHRPESRPFVASVRGRRLPMTTGTVVRTHLRHPLETRLVSVRIRQQGIRLWAKRLPVQPRPPHSQDEGTGMTLAAPLPASPPISPVGPPVGPLVNAQRWPDIATARGSRLRAAVAERLFTRVVRRLPLRVLMPDGRLLGGGSAEAPVMHLHRPEAFSRRVGSSGLVGFGEAYMAGDWDAGGGEGGDELARVLTVFCTEMASLVPPLLQRLRGAATLRHPLSDAQSRSNQKHNIARHYDLSNELFEAFLDPSMTYSSALFDGLPATSAALPAAQHRKIDRLLDAAGVGAGTELLEIGTGWGELALRAAGRGAHVLSVTLSEEQRKLALQRVEDAGLADRVHVEICDYRDVEGDFDAIVSVEMVEAVGYDYWDDYFQVLHDRLRPGGRIGLQAITMPHDRMLASRETFTWVHKYIFPGGLIPSANAIQQRAAAHGLRLTSAYAFGLDYAATLRLWRERFEARPDVIEGLGFDATFRRMWSLYLAYSEAGFASRYLDVQQIVLQKEGS